MNISSSVRIVQLAKTKAITDILTHATEGTSEGQAVFNSGLWLHHMKTGIIILNQFIGLFAFVHNDHFSGSPGNQDGKKPFSAGSIILVVRLIQIFCVLFK